MHKQEQQEERERLEQFERLQKMVVQEIEKVIQQLQALDVVAIKEWRNLPFEQHSAHWVKIKQDREKIEELRMLAKTYALLLIPDDITALLKQMNAVIAEKNAIIDPPDTN